MNAQQLIFPMPNTKIGNRTVVASTYYRELDDRDRQWMSPDDDWPDTVYLVLLLNEEPPFFTIAHIADSDEGDDDVNYKILNSVDEFNIVPAVTDHYTQWGGDY